MDEIAAYNQRRWDAMARAGALFTRPFLELGAEAARAWIDPSGWLPEVAGKRVLCLASGGGRQSACFALLGAEVTVLDLSDAVLQGDRLVAEQYTAQMRIEQGDMRDLTRFAPRSFDIVWQPYSINFVPDARAVFGEVARVIRPGGSYVVQCANPYAIGIGTGDWAGEGYLLRDPYIDGGERIYADESWVYHEGSTPDAIPPVREYRHTLATLVNGLVEKGFAIQHLAEETRPVEGTLPGTWQHLQAIVPPWMTFWTRYGAERPI